MSNLSASASLYDRLVAHAGSILSVIMAFIWGLAEATFFFIIPDVYLGFMALFHWRRALWATAAAVAGALAGGALMYALAAKDPSGMHLFLTRIPLIHGTMVETIASEIRSHGLIALVNGPLRGIPYKVYAVQAGAESLPFVPFLLMTIAARLERFLPVVLIAAGFSAAFKQFVERRTPLVVALYALIWGVVYLLYYLHFR